MTGVQTCALPISRPFLSLSFPLPCNPRLPCQAAASSPFPHSTFSLSSSSPSTAARGGGHRRPHPRVPAADLPRRPPLLPLLPLAAIPKCDRRLAGEEEDRAQIASIVIHVHLQRPAGPMWPCPTIWRLPGRCRRDRRGNRPEEDFYLNFVDWSLHNVLLVGLGNCVYPWNAATRSPSSAIWGRTTLFVQ